MMKSSGLKQWLLHSSMIVTAAAMSTMGSVAYAQEDVAAQGETAAEEEATLDKVFVTGSRIARADYTSSSPVTTVGSEEIQLSGTVSIEGLLNELPQVVPGLSSTSNNPGQGGFSTVDLRGLGNQSTLVLVDGRRLSPSTKDGLVDLNIIPAAMVESIEVVTGGTSAVYGSDAVAGVVNFILKDDFEGLEIGGLYGISGESDAKEYAIDFTVGGNFDDGKGNAVMSFSYYTRDELLQSEREFSEDALFGSSRTPAGSLERSITNPFPSGSSRLYISDDGEGLQDPYSYNFAPPNALILPTDRVNINAFVNYDINEYVEYYNSTIYSGTFSKQQLAPTPVSASSGIRIQADVATSYLTDPDAIAEIEGRADPDAPLAYQRRMVETGPRIQETDKNFFQILNGVKGEFNGWNWDLYYQYAQSQTNEALFGDVDKARFQQGLDQCPVGSEAGCTPIDPFGVNSITPEQADYIRLDNVIDTTDYEQQIILASVTGDLFELPAGTVAVAAGYEYRSDFFKFTPAPDSTGNIVGFNAVQAASGKVIVNEVFGEAIVPLVADAPFAQAINLEIGGRYSDYSTAGGVETYKVGGDWAFNDWVRARVMFNRAVRAPSVFELFQAGDQNFPSYSDPCNGDGTDPVAAVGTAEYNFCAEWIGLDPNDPATEATLASFEQSDTQVETFLFGNPDLEPETSDTITAGVVVQRDLGFNDVDLGSVSAAIDYYNIQIEDQIGTEGTRSIIADCYASLDLNSEACQKAPRLESGQLAGIQNGNVNVEGTVEVSGVDFQTTWSREMFGGTLGVNALVSYLEQYDIDGNDYAGIHNGLGGAFPEWKSNVRTTYSYNDWQFSWQWERIGEMDDLGYSAAYGYPYLEAISYHDFSVRWFASDSLEFTLTCENCTDEDPQEGTIAGYISGPNIDASTYDPIGRYFRLGARARF